MRIARLEGILPKVEEEGPNRRVCDRPFSDVIYNKSQSPLSEFGSLDLETFSI